MKKLIFCGALALSLVGCKYGLPPDDLNAPQPEFKSEQYDAHFVKEISRKAVRDFQIKDPTIFKNQRRFLVSSAFDSSNYKETYKLGRAIGEGLTEGFSQVGKYTRHINLRQNMTTIVNRGSGNEYLEITQSASDYATRMNADTIIAVTYADRGENIVVTMNMIRAIDRHSLGQYTYEIEADQKTYALSKQY